eukprot:209601-Pelagomonas_calceolata.AAC.7
MCFAHTELCVRANVSLTQPVTPSLTCVMATSMRTAAGAASGVRMLSNASSARRQEREGCVRGGGGGQQGEEDVAEEGRVHNELEHTLQDVEGGLELDGRGVGGICRDAGAQEDALGAASGMAYTCSASVVMLCVVACTAHHSCNAVAMLWRCSASVTCSSNAMAMQCIGGDAVHRGMHSTSQLQCSSNAVNHSCNAVHHWRRSA